MEYAADVPAFEFNSVVGASNHAGVDVEGVDFDIVVIFDQKEEAVERLLGVSLTH
jgi:hypothetical protein